ncbi:hypothetical protein F4781DRAFT_426069 [Annulohypoxylon bovei var. microspora]|nr:hypothetical protein F4781DRAFT_426069 [Annulohypoxylon bovei var. microspora]
MRVAPLNGNPQFTALSYPSVELFMCWLDPADSKTHLAFDTVHLLHNEWIRRHSSLRTTPTDEYPLNLQRTWILQEVVLDKRVIIAYECHETASTLSGEIAQNRIGWPAFICPEVWKAIKSAPVNWATILLFSYISRNRIGHPDFELTKADWQLAAVARRNLKASERLTRLRDWKSRLCGDLDEYYFLYSGAYLSRIELKFPSRAVYEGNCRFSGLIITPYTSRVSTSTTKYLGSFISEEPSYPNGSPSLQIVFRLFCQEPYRMGAALDTEGLIKALGFVVTLLGLDPNKPPLGTVEPRDPSVNPPKIPNTLRRRYNSSGGISSSEMRYDDDYLAVLIDFSLDYFREANYGAHRVLFKMGRNTLSVLRILSDNEGYHIHITPYFIVGLMNGEVRGVLESGRYEVQRFEIR